MIRSPGRLARFFAAQLVLWLFLLVPPARRAALVGVT
jgi:hypothetical protein